MKSRDKELVGLFDYGFGIHHAGMLRSGRGLTERLFSDGLLKVKFYQLLILYDFFLDFVDLWMNCSSGACLHGNFGMGS